MCVISSFSLTSGQSGIQLTYEFSFARPSGFLNWYSLPAPYYLVSGSHCGRSVSPASVHHQNDNIARRDVLSVFTILANARGVNVVYELGTMGVGYQPVLSYDTTALLVD